MRLHVLIMQAISGCARFVRHHVVQPDRDVQMLAEYADGLGEELKRLNDVLRPSTIPPVAKER